jgi:hypothetical protein
MTEVAIVNLEPVGGMVPRSVDNPSLATLPLRGRVVILLNNLEIPSGPYRLVMREEGGSDNILEGQTVTPGLEKEFIISVSRELLTADRYEILLYGGENPNEPFAEYLFSLVF